MMIVRIDESNTINIKLFPTYAPPPQVKAFHVPVCTVQLENLMDVNWDLTMQRVCHSWIPRGKWLWGLMSAI